MMMHFLCILKTGICREECITVQNHLFPKVSVVHTYESRLIKVKLFMIFISSAVTYFNKWGWFMIQNEKQ
jgi:hypothetical protein